MKLREISWVLVATLALCGSAASAQDQKQDAPPADISSPIQPIGASQSGNNPNRPIGAATGVGGPYDTYDPSQVSPDKNTLAGAEPFTVGSLGSPRNIFDPSISASLQGQTFPGTNGQTFLIAQSIIGGGLNYIHTWGRYRTTTLYNGGEMFISCNCQAAQVLGLTSTHFQYHDASFTQEADWARWHLLLRDDFVDSAGAAFTGQGMGGPGLIAQSSSTLGAPLNSSSQAFLPGETINTAYTMRYMNAVLGQAEYSISRKSVLTFSGSYGVLHFFDPGYFSSTMVNGQAGYDYLIDPFNSVAILATYGKIDYTGTGISMTDYGAALAYGRKITGRLAFQVSAGPQKILSYGAGGVGNFQLLSYSANSALTYATARSGLSLSYASGLNGGSGVLLGSTSYTMMGSANYLFSRFWTGSIFGGYAINNSLAPAGVPTVRFDNWFSGVSWGLLAGRHLRINFSYSLEKQNNPATCPVPSCGSNMLQQTVGLNVNWHLRPVS